MINQYDLAIKHRDNEKELCNILFERGVIFNRMRRFDKAIQDFSMCITMDDTFVDAFFNRGIILHQVTSIPLCDTFFRNTNIWMQHWKITIVYYNCTRMITNV